jgi:ABC-2 type transport system ATP-binding protein
METLLDVRGLTKAFGAITAVDAVSFKVDRGEVLGFLGPNGAGKTTTMRMLTGFLAPTRGTAAVCSFDVVTDPVEVKRRIGYLPEGAPLYGDMTTAGFLDFIARLRGLRGAEKARHIETAVARLELGSVFHQVIDTLSKGFKRRVGLAQALLLDPEVLILDEPTDGLDPNQKHQVRELLHEMAGKKAIVVSTHILEEVDAVCTRAIIINQGRIVVDASPEALEARSRYHNAVTLRVPQDKLDVAQAALGRIANIAAVEPQSRVNGVAQLLVVPSNGKNILGDVRQSVSREGIPVEEIYLERGHLDDVFRDLTTANSGSADHA